MIRSAMAALALTSTVAAAQSGQVPFSSSAKAFPVSSKDRFYTANQFSNTVSVIDPASNKLLGEIRLGDPTPQNLSPLYRGQLLVHGLGFSPDRRTLAVVSIGSNSVTFIDTQTNRVRQTTYVGRAPHEAFFTPDGQEVWVSVRGEDYLAVLDAASFREVARIKVPDGPGMTIFSPDGQYAYVCSSFTPETVIVAVQSRRIVGRVRQDSPFCPNIAATPDGRQIWFTLKDTGRVTVFEARPPFRTLSSIETGAITNHVNIVRNAAGQFAYVTVGTQNLIKVFRTDNFTQVASIAVGALPHGLWPSGDGTRLYVGMENGDEVVAIDTLKNEVVARIPVGQGPQAVAYLPDAVPAGDGVSGLAALSAAEQPVRLTLGGGKTQVAIFDQGQLQILQAAASGLSPASSYILALATQPDGGGQVEVLAAFKTNPAGSAVVDTVGPLRAVTDRSAAPARRYLVLKSSSSDRPVQVQDPDS